MKRITLEQWEKKYITGPVQRFDQKNTLYMRTEWDPTIKEMMGQWGFTGELKEKAGYTLWDFALRRATQRVGRMLMLSNDTKPNSSKTARAVISAIESTHIGGIKDVILRPKTGSRIDTGDPQEITHYIKKAAIYFGADMVGICRLDKRWIYSHTWGHYRDESDKFTSDHRVQEIPDEFQYAIVMAYEEDYQLLKYYPTWIAHSITSHGYARMAITNSYLSEFVCNLGFKAIDCSTNDVALSIPMAMQAGLGELGRHGLLIAPRYGPRIRLSKIITDLPLVPDKPIEFGVTEYCEICMKCANSCPSQAILATSRTNEQRTASNVANELKWPIDPEKCRVYWARSNRPCTTCIACCPYNKPDTPLHRSVSWFADNMRFGDLLYVKADDWMGYGKPMNPDRFWEEWNPQKHKITKYRFH